jgi:hypothetical protein
MFSGGKLDGTLTRTPQNWSFTDAVKTVQLETQPSEPYSVNIWVVAVGPVLYVHAGDNRATWVEHLEVESNVRLRIERKLYELVAMRVEDNDEFALFSDAYEEKYDRRPGNENVAEAYLFRLSASN